MNLQKAPIITVLLLLFLSNAILAEPQKEITRTPDHTTIVYRDYSPEARQRARESAFRAQEKREAKLRRKAQEKLVNERLQAELKASRSDSIESINERRERNNSQPRAVFFNGGRFTGFDSGGFFGFSSYGYGLNPGLYPYGYGYGYRYGSPVVVPFRYARRR